MVTLRIRVKTRDGNFVKELGENDFSLSDNNTSGDRRPRIGRANIGVKRDKGMSSDQDAFHEREGVAWQEQSYLSVFLIGQGP